MIVSRWSPRGTPKRSSSRTRSGVRRVVACLAPSVRPRGAPSPRRPVAPSARRAIASESPLRWADMAAAPGGAAPPPSPPPTPPAPPCACSNITIMQLFHELKQQFPAVPDHIVSSTISAHCHDRDACASRLQVEAERLLAAVHPARARHPPPHAVHDVPKTCPNRAESPPPKYPDAPPPPAPPQIKTLNKAHLGSEVLGIEPSPDSRPKRPDSLALVASPDSFPLNVSVNLNCRMDIAKGGSVEPSRSVGSPGSYTSLNLTVCTPTSVLDRRAIEEDSRQRGFEGRVQITLSSGPTQSVHSGVVTPRRQTAHEVPEQSPLSPTGETFYPNQDFTRQSLTSLQNLIE